MLSEPLSDIATRLEGLSLSWQDAVYLLKVIRRRTRPATVSLHTARGEVVGDGYARQPLSDTVVFNATSDWSGGQDLHEMVITDDIHSSTHRLPAKCVLHGDTVKFTFDTEFSYLYPSKSKE